MSLAVEWSQFGILVNAVAPGVILSSGTARYPAAVVERGIRETPLKRAGTVDEVAAALIFLPSPGAPFITGPPPPLGVGQPLGAHTGELPRARPPGLVNTRRRGPRAPGKVVSGQRREPR